ncbi:MAG: hypothetical protein ACJAYG_002178 [Oceanicoccus sp.]
MTLSQHTGKIMSIGSWNPDTEQAAGGKAIDPQILRGYIVLSQQQQLEQLSSLIDNTEQQDQAYLMTLEKTDWIQAAADFSDEDVEHLIRFFTIAEQLAGWEAGSKSPVIGLGKSLKQRGKVITRELVLWIKANSNNQYLPHGPL